VLAGVNIVLTHHCIGLCGVRSHPTAWMTPNDHGSHQITAYAGAQGA
jgi:hypothetical protein